MDYFGHFWICDHQSSLFFSAFVQGLLWFNRSGGKVMEEIFKKEKRDKT
jgi:hypothetical protein